jgi:ribosomal protein S18 acetylase RimI-like enzyme
MYSYDGHRGWINLLGVDPDCRRQGLGRELMAEVERRLRAIGCPKINLQVRQENAAVVEFYRSLGFSVDPVLSLGKRLSEDLPDTGK